MEIASICGLYGGRVPAKTAVNPEKSQLKNNFFECVKMAKIRGQNSNLGGFFNLAGCSVVFFNMFKWRRIKWLKLGVIVKGTITIIVG
ncbi:hypothetical protein [Photobacterium rosenbergii]|uniref:Uncharacterized protein n=1 Tax=Photobacterium rosenbergii TaxID=294936 RepID=A0ABU3ZDS6_9GAMM|nr:hypothetical protein [Photobacterium rosenbergii]MDV5168158.1 hypothetical protein [Photobacterium rosenbergii]